MKRMVKLTALREVLDVLCGRLFLLGESVAAVWLLVVVVRGRHQDALIELLVYVLGFSVLFEAFEVEVYFVALNSNQLLWLLNLNVYAAGVLRILFLHFRSLIRFGSLQTSGRYPILYRII